MRTREILEALSQEPPGILVHIDSSCVLCMTLYEPNIRALGKTVFEVAFEIAYKLFKHPDCPKSVKEAIEEYDQHTHSLIY